MTKVTGNGYPKLSIRPDHVALNALSRYPFVRCLGIGRLQRTQPIAPHSQSVERCGLRPNRPPTLASAAVSCVTARWLCRSFPDQSHISWCVWLLPTDLTVYHFSGQRSRHTSPTAALLLRRLILPSTASSPPLSPPCGDHEATKWSPVSAANRVSWSRPSLRIELFGASTACAG
jgi:hypothetical protein